MLVLRRRPGEAIVFDGGLRVVVTGLEDQRAWLQFAAPGIAQPIGLAVVLSTDAEACIAVRGPRAVAAEPESWAIRVECAADDATVLLVNRRPGEALVFPGLQVTLRATAPERAELELGCAALVAPVVLSAFPASGGEVKLGIDAPREVRVLREEVWSELEAANTDAGRAWTPEELADLSAAFRRR